MKHVFALWLDENGVHAHLVTAADIELHFVTDHNDFVRLGVQFIKNMLEKAFAGLANRATLVEEGLKNACLQWIAKGIKFVRIVGSQVECLEHASMMLRYKVANDVCLNFGCVCPSKRQIEVEQDVLDANALQQRKVNLEDTVDAKVREIFGGIGLAGKMRVGFSFHVTSIIKVLRTICNFLRLASCGGLYIVL